MNEERTGKCLRQVQHIRGHLWHRHFVAANQVMVATIKLSKWWLHFTLNLMINDLYPSWYICNQLTCNIGMIRKRKKILSNYLMYLQNRALSIIFSPKIANFNYIICLFKKINLLCTYMRSLSPVIHLLELDNVFL